MFRDFQDSRGSPADEVSCETLIDWCGRDPDVRYPFAASIVTFARRADRSGQQVWSEQAKALLAHAPDPERVLLVFVDRFELTA